jgi:hypothetical protein
MKVHTGIQRVFKRKWDNTYQEYIIHLLHFEDLLGNKSTKHDKTIIGGIWKEAKQGDIGSFGEAIFFDAEENREKRLIKIRSAP